MVTDHPARDLDLERWFTANHLTWSFDPAFPLSKIDRQASLAAQTRTESISTDVIDRYAADYAAGDTFPAFPITKRGRRHTAVGGYHRLTACAQAERTTHPVYVIDQITDEQAHLLALEDNRRHGIPLSDKERAAHGLRLVDDHGYTQADAARAVGLSSNKLLRHLNARRGDERAARLNLTTWSVLSSTARALLNSINDDARFAKTVRLAAARTVKAIDVGPLVGRLNSLNPAAANELIAALEHDAQLRPVRAGGRPPSISRAPAVRLLTDLGDVLRYQPTVVAAGIDDDDLRTRIRTRLKDVARRCMEIDKELAP